jgi:hypothetical protein
VLSPAAARLLERARVVEHAVDLYFGATHPVDGLIEVLRDTPQSELDERALFNLLFAAGEVSHDVDVYRAHQLFSAAQSAVARLSSVGNEHPHAAVVEMCFDFFFARKTPLVPLRGREVVAALGSLLEGPRAARRAAIHGLGHLVALGRDQPWAKEAVALLDAIVDGDSDDELRRYAGEARTGELP